MTLYLPQTYRLSIIIDKSTLLSIWSGETALRRYGAALWAAGHQTVNLLPDMTAAQTPHIMCITGADAQRHTVKVPSTKGIPPATRQTIEQYLKLVDWASLLANTSPQKNDQSWTSSTEFLTWQETQLTPPESGKSYQKQHSAREICITLMFVACVK